MCDEDTVFIRFTAIVQDHFAISIGHFQAVDHHQGTHFGIYRATPQLQHFRNVSFLKVQFAIDHIVLFIESTARN
ncbi:hypothetical protein D3C80_2152650 [compost metagenome]